MSAPRARRKPVHIARGGNVRVPVYAYADGRFCVAWTPGRGLRQKRETFPTLAAAKLRAHEVADAIENGKAARLELTGAAFDGYVHAMQMLAPVGIPIAVAIEEFVAAKSMLPPGESLATAVESHLRGKSLGRRIPIDSRVVLDRLIASISAQPVRTMGQYRYRQGIRNDLGRFVAAFPRLDKVTASEIREYLAGLGVGPRRHDNVRDEIVQLFRFAKTKDGGELFEPQAITEAELVKRYDEPTPITTYSAAELELLLRHIAPKWLPWLAIAAFSGLRPSEILRLDWSACKWGEDPPRIAIPGTVARKTKRPRRAEFGDALRQWLAPSRGAVGPLYGCGTIQAERRLLNELALETKRLAGVITQESGNAWGWKADALRHSYGSYRYAQTKDFAIVASWMGNSPQVVKERYYDCKSEQEAAAWFSVLPAHAANVVQIAG